MRLEDADDDVLPSLATPPALVQHRVGLADARSGAEVEAKLPARHALRLRLPVERQVELEHVHARLAEEPERASVGVLLDERQDVGEGQSTRLGDAGCLKPGILRGRCGGRDPSRTR